MQQHRPTFGASMSPTGSNVAHIVNDGGYPHAVQRHLQGPDRLEVSEARTVELPVDGPVVAVRHSDDGAWLACEVNPHGSEHSQVWIVSTDPADTQAHEVVADPDRAAHLVCWDGDTLVVSILDEDGRGESRLVEPASGQYEVVDRSMLGQLVDAHDGAILLRTGQRGQQRLLFRDAERELDLYPHERDSVTDDGRLAHERGPDGQWRALVRTDHGGEFARLDEVSIAGDTVSTRVLAEREGCELDEFEVSLDGSTAALLWNVRGGRSELQLLDTATGAMSAPIHLPEPVASGPSISGDGGRLALTMEGLGQPQTVDVIDPRSKRWAPIDHVRPDVTAVLPDLVEVDSHDGLGLSGWLYRPPTMRGPGPLMLWFHGGPEAQYRPGFDFLFPTILDAGITVFAPNVRGSTGFGRRFAHADDVERRWDGIADVPAIVTAMVERGIADPGRICMAGRSYGGYLTWTALARYPELFACGIPVCGMSSLVTFYENTEPGIALAAHSKYGHPERDARLLEELSAMPIIDRVRVPVLAIHGGEDTNVPVSESTQAVEALVARGIEARAEVFDGEGHTFTTPENLLRQARLMTDFMTEHLG